MSTTLQNDYKERIVPALEKEFNYTTVMQVPRLKKIVINQGLGAATQDKKLIGRRWAWCSSTLTCSPI